MKNLKSNAILFMVFIMIMTLVSCGNDTSFDGQLNVVEATEVAEVYLTGENTFIIDARGVEAYDKGHLKNAICLSPSDLVVSKPVQATIAPKAKVERVLSEAGITNDSTIYIYDDNGGVSAGRVWWTLKVYGHENVKIINGGASELIALELELTTEIPDFPKSDYIAKDANEKMISGFDYVKTASENPESDVKIIDVRSIAEYEAGSIPGAKLYPHTNNLYKDGTFMSARDTYLFYNDKGFNRDDEIILYCKSSFRATQTLAILEEAGYVNVSIYDGAWLEWESLGGASNQPSEKAPITNQDGS